MERLSNEELERIRERAEKATGGEWELYSIDKLSRNEWYGVVSLMEEDMTYIGVDTIEQNDASFIAHAREDIPKLLAEIKQLRELLNKAYQYGITSEAHQNDEDIKEIYEYLYGGDSE